MVEVRLLRGAALEAALDDVARLRIAVFRDFPYLYNGDLDYERRYLEVYRESADAVLVGAFDEERLVGAATGTPMEDHAEEFAEPLSGFGVPLTDIFYCAESVLEPDYRGRGIGHRFFDLREAHAGALGRTHAVFCAVVREDAPQGYRPLDPFWRKRGYEPLPGAVARFSWREVGAADETEHRLKVWWRAL